MNSKFLRPMMQFHKNILLTRKQNQKLIIPFRKVGEMLPPSQYDIPIPKRLHLMYALRVYWEIIPLFITTCVSVGLCLFSIGWACNNKVDVVFSTHNRSNISRTMDLRNPSVHKLFIIHQRYDPWPEMQDVLDKMEMAEKRAKVRMESCSHA